MSATIRVAKSDPLIFSGKKFWWEIHQRLFDGKIVFTCIAFDPEFPEGFMVNDAPTLTEAQEQAEAESAQKFLWSYDFAPSEVLR